MQVYLIRHAHALAGEDDAARPLSKKGRAQVQVLARFLRENGVLGTREFWHSPLVRSAETARRLVKRLRIRGKLVQVTDLVHEDNPAIMAKRLNKLRRPVAVVGHEPHLSALASLMIARKARPPLFHLRKGAVLALEKTGNRWVVGWQVAPGTI